MMSAYLSISNDSQYLFTEPFNVNRLHGVGCGTTGTMLRAEDLMFIYEALQEFIAYTQYLNSPEYPSSRLQYDGPSSYKYSDGMLLKPMNPGLTNRVYYVNGTGDSPCWFDSKANLIAPDDEYDDALPNEYILFGLSESDCYHYSDIYYTYINQLYSSSRELYKDAIHRFYASILILHGMWFRCNVHRYQGEQTYVGAKHKGGNDIDTNDHDTSYTYPLIEDYPEEEQSSTTQENVSVPSLGSKTGGGYLLYSFSAFVMKRQSNYYLFHQVGEDQYEPDDFPTLSDVATRYDYGKWIRKTSDGYPIIFRLWDTSGGMFRQARSFKVFAKMIHRTYNTTDGHTSNTTKYRMIDVTDNFHLSQRDGMFTIEGEIDGDDATTYFNDVKSPTNYDIPNDPPEPIPGEYSETGTYSGSEIGLYELFAVVKPSFNATFME